MTISSSFENQEKREKRVTKRYQEMFSGETDFRRISARLAELDHDTDIDLLRDIFCNELLYSFCAGYAKYPDLDSAVPVKRIKLVATDGATNYKREYINAMDDGTFDKWMDYHFTICERQDLIGASHHTVGKTSCCG